MIYEMFAVLEELIVAVYREMYVVTLYLGSGGGGGGERQLAISHNPLQLSSRYFTYNIYDQIPF